MNMAQEYRCPIGNHYWVDPDAASLAKTEGGWVLGHKKCPIHKGQQTLNIGECDSD